jgi:curved DNA-binding protein CbpA
VLFYKLLGLTRTATQNEIRSAYKRLAKINHPDINKSNNSDIIFKTIKIAYDVLNDVDLRAKYDKADLNQNNHILKQILHLKKLEIIESYNSDLIAFSANETHRMIKLDYLITKLILVYSLENQVSPTLIETEVNKLCINQNSYFYSESMRMNDNSRGDAKGNQTDRGHEEKTTNNKKSYQSNRTNHRNTYQLSAIIILTLLLFTIMFDSNVPNQNSTNNDNFNVERNPDLYWDFNYASQYASNAFFASETSIRRGNNFVDIYCTVIGISAIKNTSSEHYLDDTFDQGKRTLNLDMFTIGGIKPSYHIDPQCNIVNFHFKVAGSNSITVNNRQTIFLYFEVPRRFKDADQFLRYKTEVIGVLSFND